VDNDGNDFHSVNPPESYDKPTDLSVGC
jgi:hypothetical protein